MARLVPINLQFHLRHETFTALSAAAKDQPLAEALSMRCVAYLDAIANGGLMLAPEQVQKIEKAIERPVTSGHDVVAAASRGVGIEEGESVFPVRLDPSWTEPLRLRAFEMGRTPAELIGDAMQICLENQWLYGLEARDEPKYFTPPEMEYLKKLTGKSTFTGSDIVAALKSRKREEVGV